MELIEKYFPDLDHAKSKQFAMLGKLYADWNEKINVISRKDIDHLYEHHVLHSLALAKYDPFQKGMTVLDVGTGGGFPGIPLAIMYPDVEFTLLDSIRKKIHVVNEVVTSLNLKNVMGIQARAEEHEGNYDLLLSRALSSLSQMVEWTDHLTEQKRWITLKGGDRKDIRKELPPQFKISFTAISDYFTEEYFQEKWIVDVIAH
ncbi:MAG: 16S rRNA (guanine(527)-N(7))-methyltransferase RsmG [Saprospiraceae bacterium]